MELYKSVGHKKTERATDTAAGAISEYDIHFTCYASKRNHVSNDVKLLSIYLIRDQEI
jgi:hypothetical protein